MWRLPLLLVLTTLNVMQCDHQLCSSGYSRGQYLDASSKKYLLCWKVDWSDRSITFSAKVATTGWIGLGFSPTGFMPNSDVVIGWVKDGRGYLKVGTTSISKALATFVHTRSAHFVVRIVLQLRGHSRQLTTSKTSNCCRSLKQTG